MESISSFPEFVNLLQESKWGREEVPPAGVKDEGDSWVFVNNKKKVNKKQMFKIKTREGEEEVEYSAEQIVFFYRTRDLAIKEYLLPKTTFKKVSITHRSSLIELMKAGLVSSSLSSLKPEEGKSNNELTTITSRKRHQQQQEDKMNNKETSKQIKTSSQLKNKLSDVLKQEIRYFDRNSALNATRSFQEVIDLDTRSRQMEEEHTKRGSKQKRSAPLGTPIIIVPASTSAIINLYNAKQFLEDMNYVSYEEIKKKNPNEMKPASVYVTRRKHPQAGDIRFKVVDSVTGFDDVTWSRVVAVIVSGQSWQLKDWKWPNPAEILSHVKGFYVYFDDSKLTDQIKGWNVVALPIKHQSRNKDILQVHEMWRQIDAHMAKSFPQLLQSLIDEAENRARAEREARQKGMQAQMEEDEEDEEDMNLLS